MRGKYWVLLVLLLGICGPLGACGGGGGTPAGGGDSGGDPGGDPRVPLAVTYVGLGASDAVGIGALPLTEGYVYEIERHFEALPADVELHNLGISGARIEDIVAQERDPAIAADPDVVTLWTGANDLVGGADPEVFATALDGLLAALVSETRADVYVGDLPDLTQAPLFVLFPDPDVTAARVAAFNDRIAAVVAARGCVLVRLSAFPVVDELFFFDGFHPNNAGHEQLAAAYWAEIAPRLPE